MNLMNTIMHLVPEAKCVTYGDDHTKTIWLDERPIPTQAELDAAQPAVEAKAIQTALNVKHLAYLSQTDWYIWRKADNGTPVPAVVTAARQAAREGVI